MQKEDGMVNNFNSTMLKAIQCNMDIKFIGSGGLAKAALYYITDYISKAQLKAHVAYATLETAMRKMENDAVSDNDMAVKVKKLLTKCANALIGLQELSAPQVASYVLGLEDHFTSHKFRHLYWTSFEAAFNRECPESDDLPELDDLNSSTSEQELAGGVNSADRAYLGIAINEEGELVSCGDQIADYMYRSTELEDVSLWDFIAQVEKVKKKKKNHLEDLADDSPLSSDDEADITHTEDESVLGILGQTRLHLKFLSDHPGYATHELKVRDPADRFVPVPIGPSLPRKSDPTNYPRLMLCFFKPWHKAVDLKRGFDSWEHAFVNWKSSDEYISEVEDLLTNMQLLHECKDSRDNHFKNHNRSASGIITTDMVQESRHVEEDDLTAAVDEEALHELLQNMDDRLSKYAHKMKLDISNVIGCFERSGLYSCLGKTKGNNSISGVEEDVSQLDDTYETDWKNAYNKCKTTWRSQESLETDEYNDEQTSDVYTSFVNPINTREPQVVSNCIPDVGPSRLQANDQSNANSSLQPATATLKPSDFAASWGLNKEQTLAFNIIAAQSLVRRGFDNPLKMFLSGPAGTGKSRVFKALRAYFEAKLFLHGCRCKKCGRNDASCRSLFWKKETN